MRRRRARPAPEDRGAALILAIGFVVMITAISGGMIALVTSSLNNRQTLAHVRNRQYAADGAIEKAIAVVRVGLDNGDLACSAQTNPPVYDTLNAVTITVVWSSACGVVRASDGSVVAQSNVVFSACEGTRTACDDVSVIVRAQVNFEQIAGLIVSQTFVQNWSVNR